MEAISSVLSEEVFQCICFGILVATLSYWYFEYKKNYSYWSSRGVNGPTPLPFFGNFHLYMLRPIPDVDYELGVKHGRVYGVYEGTTPVLMIWDPKIVERIFITEHSSFKLQMKSPSEDPLFSNQIFFLEGEQLKRIRGIITSALTGSKLKLYFEQIQFDDLNQYLEKNMNNEINFSSMFDLHMLNVVSRHFYGLDLDLFNNPDHEYVTAATGFGFTATIIFIMRNFPLITPLINRRMLKTHDYLTSFISYAVEQRLKKSQEEPRRDLLQSMADAKLTDIELKANSIAMTKAGFGTTQTTLCYLSYEIAKNKLIQEKVQGEIDTVMKKAHEEGRDLQYEDLNNLPFLDACFTEVLRVHPVDFRAFRRVTSPTKIPLTDIEVPVNLLIKVPLHSLHFDPELFEDPFTFNPQRWLNSRTEVMKNCSFMAFGAGPRMCPGSHFASLNAKLVMINILKKNTLELSMKTCMDIPAGKFAAAPENVWIKLIPRAIKN